MLIEKEKGYGKHQFNEDHRKMKLENLTPEIDVRGIRITQPDINRPALQMTGYFEHFEATRLQIIGFVEYSYIGGSMPRRNAMFGEASGLSDPVHHFLPGI